VHGSLPVRAERTAAEQHRRTPCRRKEWCAARRKPGARVRRHRLKPPSSCANACARSAAKRAKNRASRRSPSGSTKRVARACRYLRPRTSAQAEDALRRPPNPHRPSASRAPRRAHEAHARGKNAQHKSASPRGAPPRRDARPTRAAPRPAPAVEARRGARPPSDAPRRSALRARRRRAVVAPARRLRRGRVAGARTHARARRVDQAPVLRAPFAQQLRGVRVRKRFKPRVEREGARL
jgi:hypothetical protein